MNDEAAAEPSEPSVWNLANAFTFLRVLLVPVIGWLLWRSGSGASGATGYRWGALALFLFAAWTDAVDGWVARRLVGVTRWGQLADPLADKLLVIGALIVLVIFGEVPWWAVVIIAAREVVVTWRRSALAAHDVVMPANIWGKVKTVTQIVSVTLYLVPGVWSWLQFGVLMIAVIATVVSGVTYFVGVEHSGDENSDDDVLAEPGLSESE